MSPIPKIKQKEEIAAEAQNNKQEKHKNDDDDENYYNFYVFSLLSFPYSTSFTPLTSIT